MAFTARALWNGSGWARFHIRANTAGESGAFGCEPGEAGRARGRAWPRVAARGRAASARCGVGEVEGRCHHRVLHPRLGETVVACAVQVEGAHRLREERALDAGAHVVQPPALVGVLPCMQARQSAAAQSVEVRAGRHAVPHVTRAAATGREEAGGRGLAGRPGRARQRGPQPPMRSAFATGRSPAASLGRLATPRRPSGPRTTIVVDPPPSRLSA